MNAPFIEIDTDAEGAIIDALVDYRPFFQPTTTASTLYVDADNGDDENDGSMSNPFQTIRKVIEVIGQANNSLVLVYLEPATADYVIDQTITDWNNIYFIGNYTTGEERNITGVTSSSAARGQEFTVSGAALTSDWIGRTVLLNDQFSDTEAINIEHVSGNTVYGSMIKRSPFGFTAPQRTMTNTGSIQRINLPVIDFQSDAIQGCTALFFAFCRIKGSQQFVNSSDNVAFVKSEVEIPRVQSARGALFTLYQCNLLMDGNSEKGFLTAQEGGTARLSAGTVYTGLQADRSTLATNRFCGAAPGGILQFFGGPIMKRLGSAGIYNVGGTIEELTNTPSDNQQLFFSDNDATAICEKAFVENALPSFTAFAKHTAPAGRSFTPICSGEISGNYLVENQRGGYTQLREGSNVTTALGTNTVSADGGNNESAYNYLDKTLILGGSVKPIIDRTYETPVQVGSDIEVTTSGDNVNNNGSSGAPYATLERAILDIGWADNSGRTIKLGAGTFTLPDSIVALNNITIEGTVTVEETRNISSPSFVAREGVVFTVDGATLSDDEWRDRHLQYTSTRNIIVKRNIGNTIYGIIYRTNALADNQFAISGTVSLLTFTTLQTPSGVDANLNLNSNLTFKFLKMTSQSSRDILIKGNPSVNFWGVQWEVRRPVIEDSTVNFWSTSYTGAGSDGMLYIGPRSTVSMGVASTFSDRLAGFNGCWINNSFGSTFQHNGLLFFRGLDSTGIRTDAGVVTDISGLSASITGKVVFDDYAATCSGYYDFNSQSTGAGSVSVMPEMTGQTTATYITEATKGAYIIHNESSDLTDATGTMTVSADGGTSESAYNHLDNTFINFGSVSSVINRNYLDDGIASDTVYVNKGTGNDVNNSGSSGSPFAGIGRALMEFSLSKKGTKTIYLQDASQTYDLDFHLINTVGITIEGVPEVNETRNVTGTPTVNRTTGVAFTVDGATLADDAWKGRILYLNDVLSDQRQILVHGNIGNTIYGRMTSRTGFDSSQNSWTGGTVDLMDFPTINSTGGSTNIVGNLDFTLSKVKLTGDNIYVEAGRLTVQWSEIDDITQIGGEIFLISSVYNPAGSATFPAIQAYAGARVRFYTGSVITDKNCPIASTDSYFISAIFGASMVESGGVDLVGLGENGIEINSADFGEVGWFISNQAPIYFVDYNGATCKAGFKVNTDRALAVFDSYRANGARIYIGECVGSIDGDYLVTAQRAADVFIDSSSSVTTDLGTNTVSADGGATLSSSAPDGTRIIGGTPGFVQSFQTGALKTIFTAVGNVGAGEDDLMTYDLPANTLYANGDTIEIVTGGVAQSTQTFKLYLGSTAILTHTFTGGSPKDFKVTATIMKDATGSQKAIANLIDGGGSNVKTEYTDVAEDETTTLTIKGTGQGTSNDDIVQELMTIKYVQAA